MVACQQPLSDKVRFRPCQFTLPAVLSDIYLLKLGLPGARREGRRVLNSYQVPGSYQSQGMRFPKRSETALRTVALYTDCPGGWEGETGLDCSY